MHGPFPRPQAWRRPLLGLALLGIVTTAFQACGRGEQAPPQVPARSTSGYDAEGRWLGAPLAPGRRPNLVVVVLDTLRADALSVGAPERTAMPRLAAFARQAVAFDQAVAPAPWTLPSVVSLLTGLLPSEHGQNGAHVPPPDPAALVAMSEVLGLSFGYETRALVGLAGNENPRRCFVGFDHVEPDVHIASAAERIERWARARDRTRPFFLLLHSFEVHDPYGPANHPYPVPPPGPPADLRALGSDPDPFVLTRRLLLERDFRATVRAPAFSERFMPRIVATMFDGLRRQPDDALAATLHQAYREGAAWVDGLLEAVLAGLGSWGLLEDTLVVVTADHGEAFGEHGALQHQRWLYDELLRIPLVMRGPPPFDRPRLVRGQVALQDLLPTFFDWVGLPAPAGIEGRSFLALLTADGPGRAVVSEEVRGLRITGGRSHAVLASARTTGWKYIVTHEIAEAQVHEELYDLAQDAGERANLLPGPPPPLPLEMVAAIEEARARVFDPARRLQPGTPPPAQARPAPLQAQAR